MIRPGLLTGPICGHELTAAHFSDTRLIAHMIAVEIALARVQADLGVIPPAAAQAIAGLDKAKAPSVADLANGVATAGVPVPALLEALRSKLDAEAANWLHWGATSQDILDTAFALAEREALLGFAATLDRLIGALQRQSAQHQNTIMLGRTRGQLATPISFGLRAAQWAAPLIALEAELPDVAKAALRVQLGGASGSRSALGDKAEEIANGLAQALNLYASPPWHTDRCGVHRMANWLARLIGALAKIGRDLALMARGEVGEATAGSGGSSTMPHKANPILAEMLEACHTVAIASEAGLAVTRVHGEDRDGAAWASEWICLPPLFEATGAALDHALTLIETMQIDADAMAARVAATPGAFAEAAVFALASKLGRAKATELVKQALAERTPFQEAFADHKEIDWDRVFSASAFTLPAAKVAEGIFARRCPKTEIWPGVKA